jgi:hypothetical protein
MNDATSHIHRQEKKRQHIPSGNFQGAVHLKERLEQRGAAIIKSVIIKISV